VTIRKGCCPTTGGSGPSGPDRFAPLVIVGNTLEGDPAVAYTTDEFHYVPDTGNGAGIATAMTLVPASGGRVYIKRGTYTFSNAGGPTGPIAVPTNTTVQGEGRNATVILGRATGDQGVFTTGLFCAVVDMAVGVAAADPAGVTSAAIITSTGRLHMQNVNVSVVASATGTLRYGIRHTGAFTLSLHDVAFIATASHLGAATPTCAIRISGGATLQAQGISAQGFDIGLNTDRSFNYITGFVCTDFHVSGLRQTNSTGGASGGQVLLNNFRFVSDSNAIAVPLDLQWFTNEIANGFISAPNAAFGVRYYRAGSTLGGSSFTNLYVSGPAVGIQVRSANYVGITSPTMFVTLANGTGIQFLDSSYGSVSQPRIECAVAGATLVDISGTGGGITITSPQFQIADGNVGTTRAVRMRSTGCQVQGGFIQVTSGGTVISIEATTNCDVNGVEIFAADAPALPLVNVDGSPGCTVNGNRLIASSRNHPKIEIVNATASSVINSNRVQSANGQIGIRFAAGTANNNCVGNFCQGSTFGGGLAVTDLGTNNVAQNYGS
jgi:hypothetical protein